MATKFVLEPQSDGTLLVVTAGEFTRYEVATLQKAGESWIIDPRPETLWQSPAESSIFLAKYASADEALRAIRDWGGDE
ncbi:hypothetical protein [Pseudoclavibacter sp. AY1H1]|uniref:hypothetical protein n=1 Tax=Pseudoclavibacter sp. AY1H1 TaxID=2080584 RepID=UPI000CE8A4DA|nr:hypothetical protein [Pseudoclavibacter sp. AY1H1]PPF36978.1 hypothetical protein C5E05_08435 [Pseudoclavibacter sp. AY1H1]